MLNVCKMHSKEKIKLLKINLSADNLIKSAEINFCCYGKKMWRKTWVEKHVFRMNAELPDQGNIKKGHIQKNLTKGNVKAARITQQLALERLGSFNKADKKARILNVVTLLTSLRVY